jgi:hypothetical protein
VGVKKKPEEPIRIKLYGLVSVTKRAYLIQLTIAAALLVALTVLWAWLPQMPHFKEGKERIPLLAAVGVWLLARLPWILLALGALYVVEAVVVLRRFSRQEALRRERLSGAPTPK